VQLTAVDSASTIGGMDSDSQAKPHLPPRPDAAELELATEQFIELHGSKRAAMRAIERAKTKGKPGRPDGPPYLQADAQILWLVTYLRREWRRHESAVPSHHALISKLVDLCWPLPPPDVLSLAKHLMGCSYLGGAADKRAVVSRLLGRDSVWAALRDQEDAVREAQTQARRSRDGVFAHLFVEEQAVKTYTPPLDLFEAIATRQIFILKQAPKQAIIPLSSFRKNDLH